MFTTDSKPSLATRLRDRIALSRDGGFTLLETLAVMVIVGLLAAITIPQIGNWRAKSYLTSTTADARNLANAVFIVMPDSGGAPVGPSPELSEALAQVKLSSGNRMVSYGSYNDTFAFYIQHGDDGPWTRFHSAYGGVCNKAMDGPRTDCTP